MTNQRVHAIIGQMTRAEIEEMIKAKEKEELVLSKHSNSIWFQESRNIYLTRIQKGGKKKQIQAKTYEEMIDRLYEYYELDGTNSFSAMFSNMITEKYQLGITAKSLKEYERLYTKYYDRTELVKTNISKIDFNEWKHFFESVLKEYSLTKKQFKQMLIVANQTINHAISKGLMSNNPIRDIMRTDLHFRPEPAYNNIKATALTEKQTAKMNEWVTAELNNSKKKPIYAHAVRFNLKAGMRFGELTGLRWSDIDFDEPSLIIQRQMVFSCEINEDGKLSYNGRKEKSTLKCAEEPRKIPLTDEMIETLLAVKELDLDSDYVFPLRYHTYNDKVKEAASFAGVQNLEQVRTHTIRTTAATNLYRKCHDVKTVQALMGHTSTDMTQKYVKNLSKFEDLKAVMCGK